MEITCYLQCQHPSCSPTEPDWGSPCPREEQRCCEAYECQAEQPQLPHPLWTAQTPTCEEEQPAQGHAGSALACVTP